MTTIKGFATVDPNEVPSLAGVFAIARYISKESTDYEVLHCDESENIRMTAEKVMTEKKFDGFDQSILYLIRLGADPLLRSEHLLALKSYYNQGK